MPGRMAQGIQTPIIRLSIFWRWRLGHTKKHRVIPGSVLKRCSLAVLGIEPCQLQTRQHLPNSLPTPGPGLVFNTGAAVATAEKAIRPHPSDYPHGQYSRTPTTLNTHKTPGPLAWLRPRTQFQGARLPVPFLPGRCVLFDRARSFERDAQGALRERGDTCPVRLQLSEAQQAMA